MSGNRRRAALGVAIGLTALAVPSAASAQAVPDASCPGPHTAITGGSDKRFAQTFTVVDTGTLTAASVVVDKFAAGNGWTFSINALAGGVPTDVALASTAIPESSIPPNSVSTVFVSFAPPLPVEAGQQYALVVARAAGQMGVGSRSGDVCPGALFESSGGGPFAPAGTGTLDAVFTVFVEPPPQPEPQPKADGTLTIDANKGKVEKGRKVTLTGQLDVASNESCEPNRQIQIQRRLKSQDDSKFETSKTVTTDAVGNFTLKQKVKKTYFYRAVVSETDGCDDETSNSQKVRVQKKKAAQEA